jgi:hypothetical protein
VASLRNFFNLPSSVSFDRFQIFTTGQGLIAQNFDRQLANATQIMADGTVYFMLVGLGAGDVVSNISVNVTTIGITPTVSKVGLYSKDGTRLASSAELGAVWTTATGTKTSALATPWTVLADDVYYVALICKAGTLPTLHRAVSTNTFTGIGSAPFPIGTQATQTDLPTPATITVGTAFAFWVGIS